VNVKLLACVVAAGVAGGVFSAVVLHARAQLPVIVPPPEQVRFRLVGDEPIATADGRSIVAGYKVLVFRDTGSGRCYVTFVAGAALSATGPTACP
jgi:hypothetical protein